MNNKPENSAEKIPSGGKIKTQSIDNIESVGFTRGKNDRMESTAEVFGAIRQNRRMIQLGSATVIIELARVQAAFKGENSLEINTNQASFKDYIEDAGLNYKTVMNQISHMRKVGPELLQMFEQMGVPVSLQRQIGSLPKELREQALVIISDPEVQSTENVRETVRGIYKEIIRLEDTLNEPEIREKVKIIEERDRYQRQTELIESRMIEMNAKMEKQADRIKHLLASQKPAERALAFRNTNDDLTAILEYLSQDLASDDDPVIRAEKIRFQALMNKAKELGIN